MSRVQKIKAVSIESSMYIMDKIEAFTPVYSLPHTGGEIIVDTRSLDDDDIDHMATILEVDPSEIHDKLVTLYH